MKALLIVVAAAFLTATSVVAHHSFASEYDSSKLAPLTYTGNDVVKLAELLRGKTAGFDSVRVLTNKGGKKDAPTAANINKALKELLAKRGKGDLVLIALSGHGVQLEVAGTVLSGH